MGKPLVCALIINYNGRKLLDGLLRTFRKTDYPNYKVVVVDNGSTDGSMEGFEKEYPWADLLSLGKNMGFSGGNNAGIRYAVRKYGPGYVLLLNNDMEVLEPGWMSEMVRAAETEPGAGIIGCKLLMPGGIIQHAGGSFSPLTISLHPHAFEKDGPAFDAIKDMDFVTGACLLIKREVLEKAGLLDERYNPIYYEDCEYCARARRRGFRVIYDGKASMQHYRPGASEAVVGLDEGFFRRWTRNRIRFVLFNLPFWWWPVIFARIFASAFIARDPRKKVFIAHGIPRRIGIIVASFVQVLRTRSPLNISLEGPDSGEAG
jgi:GT2 family glycosyltransferase